MSRRQKLNREILQRLLDYNDKNDDQRFGQLLVNAGVTHNRVDQVGTSEFTVNEVSFYEESDKTLSRVLDAVKREN